MNSNRGRLARANRFARSKAFAVVFAINAFALPDWAIDITKSQTAQVISTPVFEAATTGMTIIGLLNVSPAVLQGAHVEFLPQTGSPIDRAINDIPPGQFTTVQFTSPCNCMALVEVYNDPGTLDRVVPSILSGSYIHPLEFRRSQANLFPSSLPSGPPTLIGRPASPFNPMMPLVRMTGPVQTTTSSPTAMVTINCYDSSASFGTITATDAGSNGVVASTQIATIPGLGFKSVTVSAPSEAVVSYKAEPPVHCSALDGDVFEWILQFVRLTGAYHR